MFSLNKMNELLKKMLISEKCAENETEHDHDHDPQTSYEIDAAFLKAEFECPICFEVSCPCKT